MQGYEPHLNAVYAANLQHYGVVAHPARVRDPNNAISGWKVGMWTYVLVRPLGLANADDKALKEGGVYKVGFAMHVDNITEPVRNFVCRA